MIITKKKIDLIEFFSHFGGNSPNRVEVWISPVKKRELKARPLALSACFYSLRKKEEKKGAKSCGLHTQIYGSRQNRPTKMPKIRIKMGFRLIIVRSLKDSFLCETVNQRANPDFILLYCTVMYWWNYRLCGSECKSFVLYSKHYVCMFIIAQVEVGGGGSSNLFESKIRFKVFHNR
jgi:hypothetical protein